MKNFSTDSMVDTSPEAEQHEEPTSGKAPEPISYFKLYRHAEAMDYMIIAAGCLGAICAGVAMPLFTVVFGQLINAFGDVAPSPSELESEISKGALYFVYLAVGILVASYFEVSCFTWAGLRQSSKVRQLYLERALRQDISFYDVQSTSGDVLVGLNEDTKAFQNAIGPKVGNALHQFATFVAGIVIAFIYGWKLTLVMLSLLPLLAVSFFFLTQVMTKGAETVAAAYARAQVLASQAVTNIRTVAAFTGEDRVTEQYQAALTEPSRAAVKIGFAHGLAFGLLNAVMFAMYGLAFWYGSKLVREEGYSGGDVLTTVFSVLIGGMSLGMVGPNFPYFTAGMVAGRRLFAVIDRTPVIDIDAEGAVPAHPPAGAVDLVDVHFAYPARADAPVLHALTLSVAAGQAVALVGASGSGKSTVIQLLERFYDPLRGAVLLDGVDIRSLSLPWYRSHVGLVSQEPTLFATTIKANILLGREGAGDAEVEEAAKAANAHRFIQLMPQRYDTPVGERGVQLSGGQKQRIAIARAILKNPRVMLLDEATSALDSKSERMVQAALERLAVGRTTLTVAHRLSTIRNSDKIAVMQAGAVVEEGSHAALFANKAGAYHALVRLQERQFTAADERDALSAGNPQPGGASHRTAAEIAAAEAAADAAALEEDLALAANAAAANPDSKSSSRRVMERGSSAKVASARHQSMKALEIGDDKKVGGKAVVGQGGKEELTDEERQVKVGLRRLLSMNRPEWGYLFIGCLASALIGLVMPIFALLLAEIIDLFYPLPGEDNSRKSLLFSMLFFGLALAMLVFVFVQQSTLAKVGVALSARVRVLLMRAVLRQEIGWFDREANTSGAISSRLSADAGAVRGAAGDVIGIVVQNAVTLAAGFAIAFEAGWKMTLVLLAAIPLIIAASAIEMNYMMGTAEDTDAFAIANQTAAEGIMALRTVASYGIESKVASLYREKIRDSFVKSQRNGNISGLAFGFSQFIQFAFYALAFWYGGQLIKKGEMDLNSVMRVFMAILLSALGVGQAQAAFPQLASGKTAVARVFAVVDRTPEIDSSDSSGRVPEAVRGEIALKAVCFAYPSRPDVQVFSNFSLNVPAGQITALVGESGSGKSTIVNLIARFYDPSSGQVFLDGVDIRDLNIRALRGLVGLVSQEPMLFNATILDNIKFGKPDASMDEVLAAAAAANALEFVERQPDKFGTLLGEGGGISLSGGQKQRIAIARAVLKDPRVLLLDEATSALDAESERVVQAALDRIMVGRTSVVIAHRLTTVRNAHKIAVVQRGTIVEEGSHDELMRRGPGGAFVQLERAQTRT